MDAYIGEIRLLPYTFAPQDWAPCQGQLLSISANSALFSIIGTIYGGNGTSNFALPNFQSVAAVGAGAAPGLTAYDVGQTNGAGTVALSANQIPAHTHVVQAGNPATPSTAAYTNVPSSGTLLSKAIVYTPPNFTLTKLYSTTTDKTMLAPNTIGPPSGAIGAAHDNHQPYLALQYCICVNGIFPVRG